jgi:phosphoglycerate dehydrogenase-like enzyme
MEGWLVGVHRVWLRLPVADEDRAILGREFPGVEFLEGEESPRVGLDGVDVLFTMEPFPDALIGQMPRLEWIQATAGGANRYLTPSLRSRPIRLTTCTGIHGPVFTEFAIMLILAILKRLPAVLDSQLAKRWDEAIRPDQMKGKTIGIVGLGHIGLALARTLKALDLRVVATKRVVNDLPPFVDELRPADRLSWLLAESDVVVLCAPSGASTRGMMGEDQFRSMRRGAYFVSLTMNRATVNEAALVKAIRDGWIAGAGLNYLGGSPLSPESEVWRLPNVIVSAGLAGEEADKWPKQRAIFVENLHRYLRGESLRNQADKQLGY